MRSAKPDEQKSSQTTSEVKSSLVQFINSYDELMEAYEKLKIEHGDLKIQHAKVLEGLAKGNEVVTFAANSKN